jgi:hypothetical protein
MFIRPHVLNVHIASANLGEYSCLERIACALFVDNVASNGTGGVFQGLFEHSTLAGGVNLWNAGDSITLRDVYFPPDQTNPRASNMGVYANLIAGAGGLTLSGVNCQVKDGCLIVDSASSVAVPSRIPIGSRSRARRTQSRTERW